MCTLSGVVSTVGQLFWFANPFEDILISQLLEYNHVCVNVDEIIQFYIAGTFLTYSSNFQVALFLGASGNGASFPVAAAVLIAPVPPSMVCLKQVQITVHFVGIHAAGIICSAINKSTVFRKSHWTNLSR